jgi:Protein of unknown function (DUF3276)
VEAYMESLFSKKVTVGKTTFFFDVREAKNNSKYLTICESKPSNDGDKKYSRRSIMVFDNQLLKFREVLEEAFGLVTPK